MLQKGSTLSKFADGTELGVVDVLEGCAARDQSQVKLNPTWKRTYNPQETKSVYCLLDGLWPVHRSCRTVTQPNDLKWKDTVKKEEEPVEGDKAFGSLPFPWTGLSLASGAAHSDPLPSQHRRSWQQLQWPNWHWKLGASAFQRIPGGPEIHQTDVDMANPCC